jgi:deoxyribose-phosphate aldolase
MSIASYIDHTILKPTVTYIEIKKICEEALLYRFAAVCVPPPVIAKAREYLAAGQPATPASKLSGPSTPSPPVSASVSSSAPAPVKIATVIGFPFGYSVLEAKLAEAEMAAALADELDVVISLVALRNGDWSYLEKEMQAITDRAHVRGRTVKTIIESGILTDKEIVRCCEIYGRVGVDFVKTSTGYAEKGASVHAVELMRQHLPPSIQIKASGGIRSYTFARQLIDAGADRLGCSASVAIVQEEEGLEKNGGEKSGGGY